VKAEIEAGGSIRARSPQGGKLKLLFASEHSGKASCRDAGRAGLAATAHASDSKIFILGAATDPLIDAARILARPGQLPAPSPMGGT
jgi:hypothetical protein